MAVNRIDNELKHGEFIAEKGEQIWNWSSPAGKIRWSRRVDMFKQLIGEGKSVLEVGCGTGLLTEQLAMTKNNITAIDISPALVALAKKRGLNDNVTIRVENAYATTFDEGSFDCVIGCSVLHHLEIDAAIEEVYRLLKKGGKFLFVEPNMLNPQIYLQKNIMFLKRMAGDSPDETAFYKKDISGKLISKCFKNVMVKPFDFLHPAIPRSLVGVLEPLLNSFEKIPGIKEIAGSLIIYGEKI